MVSSVVSAVATTVDDVASILEGIQRIAGVLNTPRSVIVIVENHTKRRLTRTWDHHVRGGWAVTPSATIAARGANIYGSENKAMSIGTGTEGSVIYKLDGPENLAFYMYWNNPFIGTNKCTAFMCTIVPPAPASPSFPPFFIPYVGDAFKVVATCGAGDQEVEMHFELLKVKGE